MVEAIYCLLGFAAGRYIGRLIFAAIERRSNDET